MHRISLGILLLLVSSKCFTQKLTYLNSYKTNRFDKKACEIVAHDPASQKLFSLDVDSSVVHIVSINNPSLPKRVGSINVALYGSPNSIACKNSIIAVALENANNRQLNGSVAFYNSSGQFLKTVTVGVIPDNIVFTPDGNFVLTANEGEPDDDYNVDPEGSVSIIDISGGIAQLTQSKVTTLGFSSYNSGLTDSTIRIFGPNATVAQDLEPEYVCVSADSRTAWVTLQENNAIAIIDILQRRVIDIKGLGYKNCSLPGNGFDAGNKDGGIKINQWKVMQMYQPDDIDCITYQGKSYLITADEGDSRNYDGYSEEMHISKSILDTKVFPVSDSLWLPAKLGSLTFTKANGKNPGSATYNTLYTFGARSFSIRDSAGNLIFNSGDMFEKVTAAKYPANFNCDNTENTFDGRSKEKGCEPEGITVGQLMDSLYAFICLERIGGIMVYNITNPYTPYFVNYINSRNFSVSPSQGNIGSVGDLGPEGLIFIKPSESPIGKALLIAANEVSGSASIFQFSESSMSNSNGQNHSPHPSGKLTSVYPNPCNPTGNINFRVDQDTRANISIYDINGVLVSVIFDTFVFAGNYSVAIDGNALASGVYICRLTCNEISHSIKFAIIK